MCEQHDEEEGCTGGEEDLEGIESQHRNLGNNQKFLFDDSKIVPISTWELS